MDFSCTKFKNCDINLNVELIMEDHMKIVKKIFILSTSAILGLSFCAVPAFASKVPTDESKVVVKPTPVKPIPIKLKPCWPLRRSPRVQFLKDGSFVLCGIKQHTKSPFDSEDFEKVEGFDFCLSPRGI